jgi:hypothetical protein
MTSRLSSCVLFNELPYLSCRLEKGDEIFFCWRDVANRRMEDVIRVIGRIIGCPLTDIGRRTAMRTRTLTASGSQLERVQSRFELWRKTRKRCSPTPETPCDRPGNG